MKKIVKIQNRKSEKIPDIKSSFWDIGFEFFDLEREVRRVKFVDNTIGD